MITKENFSEIIKLASQPLEREKEKEVRRNADYSGSKTRQRRIVNVLGKQRGKSR